jgi:hypothetical protein
MAGVVVLCFIGAVLLIATAIRDVHGLRLPLIVSLGFLLAAFGADRIFTSRVTVRAFQMEVVLDGNAPWGMVGPQWADGTAPVVVYRRVGSSYCYVAFQSQELRSRLAVKRGHTVMVEYNIFTDFGREHGYNVRSVDGLLLANEKHVVRDFERFGGQMLGNGASPVGSCP